MKLTELTALSPLDGRYREIIAPLAPYCSEYALMRYRLLVEVEYFIALAELGLPSFPSLSEPEIAYLRSIVEAFSEQDALHIKSIERTTRHDVKAIEYFLKEKIEESTFDSLQAQKEFVHFGLTSQDINNTAIPLMLRESITQEYLPQLNRVLSTLSEYAFAWKDIPMLARTHGQPASPTTLGKEIAVFHRRLYQQRQELQTLPYPAKFGGATGNFNAHYAAFPSVDWHQFAQEFVHQCLQLSRSFPTTQIDHYDGLARIFDCLKRIHTILIDFCQDIWLYISMDYFSQKTVATEVGSSAMPHKVNPIDFENAEGNSGFAIAGLEFLSRKLPVSRLQRDLTDSTLLRNIGVVLGHAYLATVSIQRGLSKLVVNHANIQNDLTHHTIVLSEAIQTILRRENYTNPYETLKALTRGKSTVTLQELHEFIHTLSVPDAVKAELLALTPENYVGNARLSFFPQG